jgi:outer membrane biosynthesis protein TonB
LQKAEEQRCRTRRGVAVHEAEAALDEPPPEEEEQKSDVEEEVADSWEDVDSDEDRRKATEKEERRAAKVAQKVAQAKEREVKRAQLAKKRERMLKARETELAEVKKKRQATDDARKKKAEEARKAQEEQDRSAAAVARGLIRLCDLHASCEYSREDGRIESVQRSGVEDGDTRSAVYRRGHADHAGERRHPGHPARHARRRSPLVR